MELTVIGHIKKTSGGNYIILDESLLEGLVGIEGFSHIIVIYWLHQNDTPEKRMTLQVHPRKDATIPLTGVFATRSPLRPNPLGVATCKLLFVEGPRLGIGDIDAFDGTPVIDIKCYTGQDVAKETARFPEWL